MVFSPATLFIPGLASQRKQTYLSCCPVKDGTTRVCVCVCVVAPRMTPQACHMTSPPSLTTTSYLNILGPLMATLRGKDPSRTPPGPFHYCRCHRPLPDALALRSCAIECGSLNSREATTPRGSPHVKDVQVYIRRPRIVRRRKRTPE